MNPPIVVIHGNSLEHVTDSYKRFLEGRIREHFKLVGTPLRIEMQDLAEPFRRQGLLGGCNRPALPSGACPVIRWQCIRTLNTE